MDFLISFAQTCGEHMILTTIQLLWIALITRLLLLIPLSRLLVETALITLALKPELEPHLQTQVLENRVLNLHVGHDCSRKKIRVSILPHDEEVLPQMTGRLLLGYMLWARLIHHGLKVQFHPSKPGC